VSADRRNLEFMATQQPRTRRSPAWEQNVDRPETWAREHKWLLDEVFVAFDRDGEWPVIEAVQRALADSDTRRAVSVGQLTIDIPSELGARERDRFALTTRALSHCDGAETLLSVFVQAIRQAAEAYRASDNEHPALLSGLALKERMGLDDHTYVKVSRLLWREPWFFGNGGGDVEGDWEFTVRVEILLAEDIDNITDYLDAVARYRFGDPYIETVSPADRQIVKLTKEWEIGEQIGAGGFGAVMLATCGDQHAVAKFIPKASGADRELLFVDLGSARNVVPIIDHGETDDSWVLVMPRAEKSLRQHISDEGPVLSADAVRTIMTDITTTLVDLSDKVVHRDLKPENVLLLGGRWCLADFGISRYAEATTAPDTHKFAMTPPYAAPERWRHERATAAADVYSVGVMGYEMLSGQRPFVGPTLEDFRDQHLHDAPTALNSTDSSLASLVEECLIKAAGARPSAANMLVRLEHAADTPRSAGLARLQEASRAHANREAEVARVASEASSEGERRAGLSEAAASGLEAIVEALVESIRSAAPASSSERLRDGARSLKLGPAELRIFPFRRYATASKGLGRAIVFDVVASATVGVAMPPDQYGYEGRSHSLWFCDAQEHDQYAWFETAFIISPSMARQSTRDPFALEPGPEASEAIAPIMGAFQVAWPFTRLEADGLDDFVSRWAGWLADASERHLHRPNTMPEGNPKGSWRQA
jgi:eukaryotic-like serine/threonine-protein kinase